MEYIETTYREATTLYKALEQVKNVKGTRFAFVVAKNIKEIGQILTPLEKEALPTPEFIELSNIAHKLAENEDKEGIERLEEENKDLVEARKAQLAKIDKMLDESVKLPVQKFKKTALPEDLSTEQLLPLLSLIDD